MQNASHWVMSHHQHLHQNTAITSQTSHKARLFSHSDSRCKRHDTDHQQMAMKVGYVTGFKTIQTSVTCCSMKPSSPS